MSAAWDTSLFDCFSDCKVCTYFYFTSLTETQLSCDNVVLEHHNMFHDSWKQVNSKTHLIAIVYEIFFFFNTTFPCAKLTTGPFCSVIMTLIIRPRLMDLRCLPSFLPKGRCWRTRMWFRRLYPCLLLSNLLPSLCQRKN